MPSAQMFVHLFVGHYTSAIMFFRQQRAWRRRCRGY